MHRLFVYIFAFLMMIMASQAAPVVPQVWLDEQGQVFAIAFEGASDQDIKVLSKHIDMADEENDEEEDEMYTTPTNTVVILPNPSLQDKVVNYVNSLLSFSS
ncbi:hypothetical protein BC941DRAFT_431600 [Chlamydoabsidia padenii]|nr:hypothetical protein BC941DRAFT_431600 [Chlamydoabsidia padenii]